MNELHLFASARAIRTELARRKDQEGYLPGMMRMDEFERRILRIPGRRIVDGRQRVFYLREASEFEAFQRLRTDRDLIRFFTRSEDFFRFFEEIAWEEVSWEALESADAYAEFVDHLRVLRTLRDRYRAILHRQGMSDRMFYPEEARIDSAALKEYEKVVVHLEGYLSRYELNIFGEISRILPVEIRYRTDPYTRKMQERFARYGIDLPDESYVRFDLATGELLESRPVPARPKAEVFCVQERLEQISVAFARIESMVRRGIAPERIALILPDESLKEAVMLFDRLGNMNFAMGFDYSTKRAYRELAAVRRYLAHPESEELALIEHYGIDPGWVLKLGGSERCDAEEFFRRLATRRWAGQEEGEELPARWLEARWSFLRLFADRRLSPRQWVELWLRELEAVRIDDVRGGKITVMGVLETRGVAYDGVVIVDFNEGTVPASSGKDRFLNSTVRAYAGLPTRQDREALQKHYYMRLMERAKEVSILYTASSETLASRFLFELGLDEGREVSAPRELLYEAGTPLAAVGDPEVGSFDPRSMLWSPTRLRSWLGCRREFYYRYILGLQAPKEEAFIEGLEIHRILQRLFERHRSFVDPNRMRQALETVMDELLDPDDPEQEYHRKLWLKKLEEFTVRQCRHFASGWSVEACEYKIEGEIMGLRFSGTIDRLDRRGDEAMIVDYKSGSIGDANRSRNLERLEDFQMSIYLHLLAERYPEVQAAFIPLFEGGDLEPLRAASLKEERLLEHLNELSKTRSFVARRCTDLQRCRYCAYQLLCQRGEYLSEAAE